MNFFKSTFSESDGKGSFTRLATALLIVAALVWVTRLVWINKAMPDFGGVTLFIGTLYGLNKAGSIAATLTENKSDPAAAGPPQPKVP